MERIKLCVTERLNILNITSDKLIGGLVSDQYTGSFKFCNRPFYKLSDEEEVQVCFIVDELNRSWRGKG